jgi:hypothetical protein
MGAYFKIVNPDQRQFLDPAGMGVNPKHSGYMYGYFGQAVALLCCKADEVGRNFGPLAGSWYGHRIIAANDDYGVPDAYGIVTATVERPDRNLNGLAGDEYEDITGKAMGMLALAFEDYADAQVTSMGDSELIDVGNAVLLYEHDPAFRPGCDLLRQALERAIGKNWIDRYRRACRENPSYCRQHPKADS